MFHCPSRSRDLSLRRSSGTSGAAGHMVASATASPGVGDRVGAAMGARVTRPPSSVQPVVVCSPTSKNCSLFA